MKSLVAMSGAVFALVGGIAAYAAELESVSVSGDHDRQSVDLSFDDFPRYEITEMADGNGLVLRFLDTRISTDYVAPTPGAGLVSDIAASADSGDVDVEINLDTPSKYTLSRTDTGYRLGLVPVEEAAPSVNNSGAAALTGVTFSRVSGDRVQIDVAIDGSAPEPAVFRTVDPPRIALDFYGMSNASGTQMHRVDISSVDSLILAEDDERMRMILNLSNPADFSMDETADGFVVTVFPGTSAPQAALASQPVTRSASFALNEGAGESHQISNVDFRRTPNGSGRVIVKMSGAGAAVDLQEIAGEIVAVFPNTAIPPELEQRIDVTDFATPVTTVDTFADGRNTKLVITPFGQYKQSSVQSGDTLVIEVSPLTRAEIEAERADEFGYTGERLSLNFQRISVRAALQVIADFTGLNFVTSDAISGDLSLRLKDVPWDQALDVILQTKGLAMRQKGNVVWVAPAQEIADKERQALESRQEVDELAPLVSELIPISYAKASDVALMLKSIRAVNPGVSQTGFGTVSLSEVTTEENRLLSDRGSVTVDERTNSLLIQDTAVKLREIRELIAKLDVPVRQVQIETRIVEANDDFSKTFGARLGFTSIVQDAETIGGIHLGDTFTGATVDSNSATRLAGTLDQSADNALSVNLPAESIGEDIAASYAFSLARLGSGMLKLLDLEISALEAEGNGRVVANPKILTTDKNTASIEQGQERQVTFGSAFGTVATEGQEALLSLQVRPQITPDDNIILDVVITNDSFAGVDDTVNTKRITTQTLLENGETVVIGGIYTQDEFFQVSKVPFLGDIPWIGNLFKKRTSINNRTELLVFLTPRIIDPSLTLQ